MIYTISQITKIPFSNLSHPVEQGYKTWVNKNHSFVREAAKRALYSDLNKAYQVLATYGGYEIYHVEETTSNQGEVS